MDEDTIIEVFAEAEAFGEEVEMFAKKIIELADRWDYDAIELARSLAKIVEERSTR